VMEVDAIYSIHTYYNLLSCCLFAIPVVTGFIVGKGGSELVQAVTEGFKEFPMTFGASMGSYQRAMMAQQNIGEVQRFIYDQVVQSAWESIVKDPEIQHAVRQVWSGSLDANMLAQVDKILKASIGEAEKVKALEALVPLGKLKDVFVRTKGAEIDISVEHWRGVAVAKLRANMAMTAYHASYSDYAVGRASQAMLMMWNSHDMGIELPVSELMMVEQARSYWPMGQMMDRRYEEVHKFFFDKNVNGGK
jgi:hypothetical protein